MLNNEHMTNCENYLRARTGCYEWRSIRYVVTAVNLVRLNLTEDSLVVDVGAGWTELDYCLRTMLQWRGRYWPVDGAFDGTDLNIWYPPREADFFVALEVLEHVRDPERLISRMQEKATVGIIVSVPNPRTTDVLGMDKTHVSVVEAALLRDYGFEVQERGFYGKPEDSLFGVWVKR